MNIKKLHHLVYSFPFSSIKALQILNGYSPVPPLIIQLILTHRCNIKCHYCYQNRDINYNTQEVTLDFVKKLHENLKSSFFFKPVIYLTGGEPTICRDFLPIVQFLNDKKYRFFFCTNGTGLTTIYKELSTLKHLKNIVISHHNILPEKILSFLDLCKKEKKRNFLISMNCPVYEFINGSKNTEEELDKIIKIYEKYPLSYISLQHSLFSPPKDKDLSKYVLDCYHLLERKKFNIPVFLFPEIKKKDINLYYSDNDFPYNTRNCIYPWLITVVKPDGNVISCDETNAILGNVFETKFKNIWNGKQYRALRNHIYLKGICFDICERCCRRQYY